MKRLRHILHGSLALAIILTITALSGNHAQAEGPATPATTQTASSGSTAVATLPAVTIPITATPLAASVTIRVGYQKNGVFLLVKNQKLLEQRFGSNATVTWVDFPAGPQLLEALNAGSIDIGTTGETPPIFAQAAGTPLVYIATSLGSGAGQGIIVPADSPIKTVADLKGKKIAFNKASSAHLLTIRALEQAGLKYTDITPVFLAPADARAAFQGGSIDAWTIWDPFYSAAQQDLKARVLVDGTKVSQTRGFYEASAAFVKAHPDVIKGIVQELQVATDWEKAHKEEFAQIEANETGVALSVWEQALNAEIPDITFIDDATIQAQQKVADEFFQLQLIPTSLNIKDVVWRPADYVAPTPQATASK